MIKKVDLGISVGHGVFGNPAPLGLFGLAIACAALTPIAFGYGISKETGINSSAFLTAALFCFLFGGACQLITGLMEFANKNTFGGTIFTAFAFNWMVTGISFAGIGKGWMIDHTIVLAVEILLLVVFLFLTYGFGFFSRLLFFFLLDIDLLYVAKIIRGFTGGTAMNLPIAIFTVLLGLIGLWLALAALLNPLTGKALFPVGGPMFRADRRKGFDWSVRRAIFNALYIQWKDKAFTLLPVAELALNVKEQTATDQIMHEVCYLIEYGALTTKTEGGDENRPVAVRLTSSGIDLYEQLILKKFDF